MSLASRIFAAVALLLVVASAPLAAGEPPAQPASGKIRLYVGTLTDGAGQGIYQCSLNTNTGELESLAVAGEVKNPYFLAIAPHGEWLYACCEFAEYMDSKGGAVAAFKIDPRTGQLALLNHRSSTGSVPCHLSIDKETKNLLVANWLGGNVAVFPIDAEGRLQPASAIRQHHGSSVHKERQDKPHPHSINLDPANRFAFVADAGIDRIVAYAFDAKTGQIAARDESNFASSPGAAPRHMAFHSSGKLAFVVNELDSTVTALQYFPDRGTFERINSVTTLPENFQGENLTAEIAIRPDGKFLYASNRGHDSIAMFAIDGDSGKVKLLGQQLAGGRTPRNFAIDPTGKFLLAALQDSDRIVVHRIDPATSMLSKTAHSLDVPKPVYIKFVPQRAP